MRVIATDELLWNKRIHWLCENVVLSGDDCWEWQRAKQGRGKGKNHGVWMGTTAHRRSWELLRGPIPEGMCVLHKCDNPPCVNPNHLWIGTLADNNADMRAKGRARGGFSDNPPDHSGEKNPLAKLAANGVRKIRELYSSGLYSQAALGEMFYVSRSAVEGIVQGTRWAHVEN